MATNQPTDEHRVAEREQGTVTHLLPDTWQPHGPGFVPGAVSYPGGPVSMNIHGPVGLQPTPPHCGVEATVAELINRLGGRSAGSAPVRGQAGKVLWWHVTDRWYFGDFLRHAPWLPWLVGAFPGSVVDVATHPDYLPLLADGRYGALLDARCMDPDHLGRYDLVVVPGPFEASLPPAGAGTVLSTWDTGWELRVDGVLRAHGVKNEINYFRAAHPAAMTTRGTGGDIGLRIALSASELDQVDSALDRAFGNQPGCTGPVGTCGSSVVVYNPTSSNAFTRETSLPKEVDNALSAAEHAVVLRRIVRSLPDHLFLVGAARKRDDEANATVAHEVVRRCADPRVGLVSDLPVGEIESLRGFAALLGSARVCAVVGAGTGTNTHLAACVGTHGFSVEHGADAEMVRNWQRPGDFQMGSFRWRNPSPLAGSVCLDWSRRTPGTLERVAQAFGCHHAAAHGNWQDLFSEPAQARREAEEFAAIWPQQPLRSLKIAEQLLELMPDPVRRHYEDFTDEVAYLHTVHGCDDVTVRDRRLAGSDGLVALQAAMGEPKVAPLAVALFQDSNLHKVIMLLRRVDRIPGAAAPHSRSGGAAG